MARKALVNRARGPQKHKTRGYHRCSLCGRERGFIRDFGVCRLCFRQLAHQGEIPGVRKASW